MTKASVKQITNTPDLFFQELANLLSRHKVAYVGGDSQKAWLKFEKDLANTYHEFTYGRIEGKKKLVLSVDTTTEAYKDYYAK